MNDEPSPVYNLQPNNIKPEPIPNTHTMPVSNDQPTAGNAHKYWGTKSLNHLAIILSAVFFILALSLVAFFYFQNQQLKKMLTAEPSPTALSNPTPNDPFANWVSAADKKQNFSFKFPKEWSPDLNQSSVSGEILIFKSGDGLYRLSIDSEPNLNSKTGNPYTSLDDFIGLPYKVKSILVDGKDARQPLPRAGSETLFKVNFFSENNKEILSIELLVGDGTPTDHRVTSESIQIGSNIFDKIISTVRFIKTSPSPSPSASFTPQPVACTLEARQCADGSFVGRSGPNCEFSPCPTPRQ